MGVLGKFEGRDVIASRITVPNMGGGLNEALDLLEPLKLKHGDEVLLVTRGRVRDVDFPEFKKGDATLLARQHVLTAASVMIVSEADDRALVEVMLAANAERIQRAKDSMDGQTRIDDEIDDDELSPEELEVRYKLLGKPVPKAVIDAAKKRAEES